MNAIKFIQNLSAEGCINTAELSSSAPASPSLHNDDEDDKMESSTSPTSPSSYDDQDDDSSSVSTIPQYGNDINDISSSSPGPPVPHDRANLTEGSSQPQTPSLHSEQMDRGSGNPSLDQDTGWCQKEGIQGHSTPANKTEHIGPTRTSGASGNESHGGSTRGRKRKHIDSNDAPEHVDNTRSACFVTENQAVKAGRNGAAPVTELSSVENTSPVMRIAHPLRTPIILRIR